MDIHRDENSPVQGEFVDIKSEAYYKISHADQMPPFFIRVISDNNHWLFASSTGGLTAGRVSPDTALFPYETVDKLHLSGNHTGPKTIVRVRDAGRTRCWEPFNTEHRRRFPIRRNLYKNKLGNKLCFEEINEEFGLAFRYTWSTSAAFAGE